MSPGIWQILLVVVLVLILFGGRGKISAIMGDLAKGVTSFRKGLKSEDEVDKNRPAVADRGETIDVHPEPSPEPSKDKAEP